MTKVTSTDVAPALMTAAPPVSAVKYGLPMNSVSDWIDSMPFKAERVLAVSPLLNVAGPLTVRAPSSSAMLEILTPPAIASWPGVVDETDKPRLSSAFMRAPNDEVADEKLPKRFSRSEILWS